MSHTFPSRAWTDAYRDAVNGNPEYRSAGREWNHGAVAMIVEPEPELGLAQGAGMVLDVEGGECRGTEFFDGDSEQADAPFVIIAPYSRWKEVIKGDLDPIKAMMQGQLRLTKGHLPTMLRFVESSRQLVVSASRVPTTFLDEK